LRIPKRCPPARRPNTHTHTHTHTHMRTSTNNAQLTAFPHTSKSIMRCSRGRVAHAHACAHLSALVCLRVSLCLSLSVTHTYTHAFFSVSPSLSHTHTHTHKICTFHDGARKNDAVLERVGCIERIGAAPCRRCGEKSDHVARHGGFACIPPRHTEIEMLTLAHRHRD
jgi:hypothetical protein